MPETRFQDLSPQERHQALSIAGKQGSFRAFLLEKDIWVVATLRVLFDSPFAEHLIFKGGTSLSKAWGAIRRFSEDVDVTYDIRAIAPDFVSGGDDEALPPTRSQEKRWTQAIRPRLAEWVRDEACPIVQEGLARAGFAARFRVDDYRLHVEYEPLFKEIGFVRPDVLVEFGARSTGEPHAKRPVACDAAPLLPDLTFPEATPTVMLAERTFWEKATSMHVFCHRERGRGDRLSRHWHDVARLDEAGIVDRALADRELAFSVARHKGIFFVEKDVRGERIDYLAAVSGNLQLAPTGAARATLEEDYAKTRAGGLFLDEEEPFEQLMERCASIQSRANAAARND